MRKGIAVSPGVAIGTAYCIHEIYVSPDTKRLADREVTAELARYETARDQAGVDLIALQKKVSSQVGAEEGAIFATHAAILRDSAFTKKIRDWIVQDRVTAQSALRRLLDEYSVIFSKNSDPYLKERLNDIRDVVLRLSTHLSDALSAKSPEMKGPVIIVADELLPSQVVTFDNLDVRGIVTQSGSQTSHAAIVARSMGIPAVSGVRGILKLLSSGEEIVVDGGAGQVLVNPDAETRSAFLKLEREFFALKTELAENVDLPARTADGVDISLLANINSVADVRTAVAMGASGVGLFRTEYLYLSHHDIPDEDEQTEVYRDIIATMPGGYVTIRTLDIGGDKTVPYLGHHHSEANPFLGWRSIRLSFEHPELFATQIRAVLRAAAESMPEDAVEPLPVQLMFPMVTTLEEMRKLQALVRKCVRQLNSRGIPCAKVKVGMMLEVPAAAVMIDQLLDVCDFVSIGSNDLVQYLMAADRDNPKVSGLCQPLSPAVLRVLSSVIRICNERKKPVTVCGEMAGRPRTFILLLGMGLRNFSMSAAFIPSLKELAGKITIADAEALLKQAMRLKTTAQIKRFMITELTRIAPNLVLLDTA